MVGAARKRPLHFYNGCAQISQRANREGACPNVGEIKYAYAR